MTMLRAVNPHSAAVIRRKFLLLAPLRAGVDPLLEVLSVRLGTAVQREFHNFTSHGKSKYDKRRG